MYANVKRISSIKVGLDLGPLPTSKGATARPQGGQNKITGSGTKVPDLRGRSRISPVEASNLKFETWVGAGAIRTKDCGRCQRKNWTDQAMP